MKWASNPVTPLSEIATVCGNNFIFSHKDYKWGWSKIVCCFNEKSEWGHNVMCSGYEVADLLQWGRRPWHIPKIDPSHPIFSIILTHKL